MYTAGLGRRLLNTSSEVSRKADSEWLIGSSQLPEKSGDHTKITVDLTSVQQPIKGFGASGCWWAQHLGRWRDQTLEPVIDLLFHPSNGIGLTQYRYNIGAGGGNEIPDPWRRSECYEVRREEYDWSRDVAAKRVMRAACDRGVHEVVAFSISPTVRMTHSGYASGAPGGNSNLRPEMIQDFARFLVKVVKHLRTEEFPITHLSPINEPHWDWQPSKGQEGCHLEIDECVQVIRAVFEHIERENLELEMSVIEAHDWPSAHLYADALMTDPYIAKRLKNYAVHSYWSDKFSKQKFADHVAKYYPHLELWMSEWCEMVTGQDTGMDSALCLANTLHDDLTLGSVNAWQYWIAVSKHDFRDGLIYVDEEAQTFTETKRLWALGNYSRFIAPKSRRVAVTSDGIPLKTSAYLDPDGRKLTVVAINNSDEPVRATLEVPHMFTTARCYETSDAHSLTLMEESAPTCLQTFPARSVNTLALR